MTDAELIALSTIANCDLALQERENRQRRASGFAPAYGVDDEPASLALLRAELVRRGIKVSG